MPSAGKKLKYVGVRITEEEKLELEERAVQLGFENLSQFLRKHFLTLLDTKVKGVQPPTI